jgi:hypothetical protein
MLRMPLHAGVGEAFSKRFNTTFASGPDLLLVKECFQIVLDLLPVSEFIVVAQVALYVGFDLRGGTDYPKVAFAENIRIQFQQRAH